jgi:hypothetical protein
MDKKMTAILYQNCSHFLVEMVGLEDAPKTLNPFILKGFRYSFPTIPQNFTSFSECRQALLTHLPTYKI